MHPNRLLIIDDEPIVGKAIKAIAAGCNYQVKVTTDAVAFLDCIATWKPTHVVLDLQMPVIDGIELLRTLGALRCTAKIMIVSGVEGRIVEAARLIGVERGLDVVATLLKPFQAAQLRHLLDQFAVREDWNSATALAEALAHGALFLVYEPKVDLASGSVVGFEALARWQHPRHGLLLPEKFMPLAQQAGMTDTLVDTMIELGLTQLAAWTGKIEGTLAINLSSRSIDDLTFADRLAERCAARGVATQRLVLELTESNAIDDPLRAVDILARLRLKGFRLAIDDFGGGYCSMTQLARLPFSELKVDKCFVAEVGRSAEARAIVKSTVELAHNLGMRAVAEGVDDPEIERLAIELGCDVGQGQAIAPPMTSAELPTWLDGWTALAAQRRQATAVELPAEAPVGSTSTVAYDGSVEANAVLVRSLTGRIDPLWGFGQNSLAGWCPAEGGIDVLMVPYHAIVGCFGDLPRLLRGRRLMGERTFQTARRLTGRDATHVALPYRVGDGESASVCVPTTVVEDALRRYSITETQHRAVTLFDIVGFSRLEPRVQLAQLHSLECSINTAREVMARIGKAVDLARATTGDGFYIWNRDKGAAADLDTYLLTMLALADNAIARHRGRESFVPELRTCFSVGQHLSYHQCDGVATTGQDHIVGDVTVGLAQMISKCLPGQILIGDFTRPIDEEDEPATPVDFMIKADGALNRFDKVMLHGHAIRGIRCYLTGQEPASGAFDVVRFRIRDRLVFNQKVNIYLGDNQAAISEIETLLLGLRQSDLAAFETETASA